MLKCFAQSRTVVPVFRIYSAHCRARRSIYSHIPIPPLFLQWYILCRNLTVYDAFALNFPHTVPRGAALHRKERRKLPSYTSLQSKVPRQKQSGAFRSICADAARLFPLVEAHSVVQADKFLLSLRK